MDARLLEILVCPLCKGPLDHRKLSDQTGSELVCKACRFGFPIKDDIPIMLEDEARQMPAEEE